MTGDSHEDAAGNKMSEKTPDDPPKTAVVNEYVLEKLEEILETNVEVMMENAKLLKKLSGTDTRRQTSAVALRHLDSVNKDLGQTVSFDSETRRVSFTKADKKFLKINHRHTDLRNSYETIVPTDNDGCREYDTQVGAA